MWIVHDYRVARTSAGTSVAIGNFDGVHLGHQEILRRAVEAGRSHGVDSVAITFEPHPTRILAPDRASPQITVLDRKLEHIAQTGIACAVVQGFDRKFSSQTPREFAREVLVGLRAREVYVGGDFHFGKDRAGNGAVLAELGRDMGFAAIVVPPIEQGGMSISSTRVRAALAGGDLATVRALLGRRYDFDGLVVEGDRRGRALGYPTANLRTAVEAIPADGVYAVWARVLGREGRRAGESETALDAQRWMRGVMNVGVRPTFAAGRSLEVHLLDISRELYGATLRVEVVERVRDEARFEGVDALRAQIARDVQTARGMLSGEER